MVDMVAYRATLCSLVQERVRFLHHYTQRLYGISEAPAYHAVDQLSLEDVDGGPTLLSFISETHHVSARQGVAI